MLNLNLDKSSRRVIGVLIEKELTTPNLYPLSVNALTNGCNQKTSRDPVMNLREFEVEGVLRQLYLEGWVTNVSQPGGRVLKWKHRFDEKLALEKAEVAVMAELLLRGAAQPGELRSNANRLHPIATQEGLQQILDGLVTKSLVRLESPRPGERTRRWNHTLDTGEPGEVAPEIMPPEEGPAVQVTPRPANPEAGLLARIAALEARVAALEARANATTGAAAEDEEARGFDSESF